MGKKMSFTLLLFMLIFTLSACGNKSDNTSTNSTVDEQASEDTTQGLDWPNQYMSTLPEPTSLISNIQKLNVAEEIAETDTTTQPTSVNVTMNQMTKKEANLYYEAIKAAGFEISTDETEDGKILLVGVLNDTDKNPFVFSYLEDDHFGNVSITFVNAVYGNQKLSTIDLKQI